MLLNIEILMVFVFSLLAFFGFGQVSDFIGVPVAMLVILPAVD